MTHGLVKPSHGKGFIRHGSLPGGKPGPGRPPSAIRADARQSYDERRRFLEEVIDGEMIEQKYLPAGAKEPVVVRKSADIADRLKALKELRETGLGTLREASTDDVRQKNYALKLTLFAAEFLTEEQRVRLWRRLTKAYASGEKCISDPDPSEVPA